MIQGKKKKRKACYGLIDSTFSRFAFLQCSFLCWFLLSLVSQLRKQLLTILALSVFEYPGSPIHQPLQCLKYFCFSSRAFYKKSVNTKSPQQDFGPPTFGAY